ncbi:MAG: ParB/RepB/Spo0J family partition protein [Chloroflexota bacterium]
MAKERPRISLAQAARPHTGDLEKLFATQEDVEQAAGMQLAAIRVEAIMADPNQPRRTFPEASLLDLSESIRQVGVIQPIEVTEIAPNQFLLVHGERRWRAAQLAGLATIPAVVRRRDYSSITRFVRQLVENIQREDLNDVDRAAGLLHLRELMQAEAAAKAEGPGGTKGTQPDGSSPLTSSVPSAPDSPWAKTVTWAKVGKRLGMSRQRIHQLIQLLKLPDEIKEAVRQGTLTERDTRVYQGLRLAQQRALHQARLNGELDAAEVRRVADQLKEAPAKTLTEAVRELRQPPPKPAEPPSEQRVETSFDSPQAVGEPPPAALRSEPEWLGGTLLPPRQGRPTGVDRLDWVRGHLARVPREGLSPAERRELLRLLRLVQLDVASLIEALGGGNEP